ncbi:MAG: hypothetical protein KUG78_18020 [Kangiellaceae bacterium]|nr:hypothetical protein [Kangiellaceae bacterium]
MANFDQTIETLVVASVAVGFLTTYLTLNKLWSRKSDENVAKSVSVFASILGILSTIPFLIKYGWIDAEYKGAIKALVGIIAGSVFLLIGSGFWVRDKQKPLSLWTKLKRAIKLETNEAGDLVKALIKPTGADKMLEILKQLALIDNKVSEKEFEFIEIFAKTWYIPFQRCDLTNNENQNTEQSLDSNYLELRNSVIKYIDISPPTAQATHLRDVLNALANADKMISDEEKFILAEVNSMLADYSSNSTQLKEYQVLVAPQDEDQVDMLKNLLPELVISSVSGGKGYLVGSFFSLDFAKMVCKKYRSLNLFTAIESSSSITKNR